MLDKLPYKLNQQVFYLKTYCHRGDEYVRIEPTTIAQINVRTSQCDYVSETGKVLNEYEIYPTRQDAIEAIISKFNSSL